MTEQLHRPVPAPAVPAEYLDAWTELRQQRDHRGQQLSELGAAAVEAATTADETRRELTRALVVAARQAMSEIEAALQRLEAGTFGRCEGCASAIAAERLEILPMSRYCTPCQRTSAVAARRP